MSNRAKPPTFASQWPLFEACCVADEVDAEVREGLRRAFYAGAGVLFSLMADVANSSSEAQSTRAIKGWSEEVHRFIEEADAADVAAGMEAHGPVQ